MTRRFEFIAGSSGKFWEISMSGVEVTVNYGRIGTHGQSQTKSFPNAEKAQQHAEKLMRQKLGKGYVEFVAT
jgi:predicted DNA-binding WGR domain protein